MAGKKAGLKNFPLAPCVLALSYSENKIWYSKYRITGIYSYFWKKLMRVKMKNVLLILAVVFGLFACEGPMGPQGPEGRPGQNGLDGEEAYWHINEDCLVKPNMWTKQTDGDGSNLHYACTFRITELTQERYLDGLVNVYIFFEPEDVYDGYIPLGDAYPVENSNGTESWIEFYSCIIRPGEVTFTLRLSDFAELNPAYLPEQRFKVVIHY